LIACIFYGEKRLPAWFHNPADMPCRMSRAQGSDRGKRVKNIAHGAQTHHEQAEVGLRMQSSIFAQGDGTKKSQK
jgi:hypothetical protein